MKDTKIKIKYSELKKKSKEELLEMKNKLTIHNQIVKKGKGYCSSEVRKNIARINQLLNEMKREK